MAESNNIDLNHPVMVYKFSNLGLSQASVANLPEEVKEALSSGALTPLIMLNIKCKDNEFLFPARLRAVFDEKTNQPELLVYGVQKKLTNSLQLNGWEFNEIKKGNVLTIKEGEKTFYAQLDPKTQNIIKVPSDNVPVNRYVDSIERILDIGLSMEQRQRIMEGKAITLDVGGEDVTIGVDLLSPNNFKQLNGDLKEWERQKEIEYDMAHPEYVGIVQTDENRWEYQQLQIQQAQKKQQETSELIDTAIKIASKCL